MIYKNSIDLWGITRSDKFIWLTLLISISFVVLEAKYNIDLLSSISNPNTDSSVVADLSERGKLLASVGISWVLFKGVLRIKPALLGLLLFMLISSAGYYALDFTYTKVIQNLESSTKVQGFNLFAYRQDILKGNLHDPDLPTPKDDPVIGKILMGAFPIIILDDRYMLPAQDILKLKANDKRKLALKKAEAEWPGYEKYNSQLNNSYVQFISQSKQAYKYRYYGGIQRFKNQSGGMSPNPNASRNDFLVTLKNSKHPQAKKLIDYENKTIAQNTDGTYVYGRELPFFLDHEGYINWFESKIKQSESLIFPTNENVENFKGIDEINSAVFLPPMAIITSLLSATTNFITVMIICTSMLMRRFSNTNYCGKLLQQYSPHLSGAVLVVVIFCMPSHAFKKNTALHDLENLMHSEVGIVGELWSRLSNLQKIIL